ncbi:hypothetical protein B7P43_G03427 [Cryptotermes secundus]|uniref:Chloride channel CLIC-like protein 1 n=1 Tax=Cryptotermes secundus TaxID=105785 RepID=A0A2J7RLN5_9NEOP|nr:uncharacterized protein LOC111871218 isoform X2 [Cryptotermes secundus]PNF41746.1 hypothetical protein B7P43_G03427 [Cryptotermes secundus]
MRILFLPFFAFLFIILNVQYIRGSSNYHIHEKEWLDPDPLDRIYRDYTARKESRNPTQARKEDGVKFDELAAVEGELECGMQSLSDSSDKLHDLKYQSYSTPPPEQKNSDMITEQQECMQSRLYMRRFINILLKVSKLEEEMPENLDAHLYITVTPEQLTVLQQFSEGSNDVTLHDLDSVLSSVLFLSTSDASKEYIPWFFITDILLSKEVLMTLVFGCLLIFLMWKVLNGHSLYQIVMMFLVSLVMISFFVTYCRLYKEVEIKQYATIKTNPEVPLGCRPSSDLSWYEAGMRLFHRVECHKYYEAVMLDPALKVTPTVVLSEMVADFILHPSGKLGSAIADFSNNILENLPWGTNYLVLIASFFFIAVIICASCGAVVKLPFYMGGLEISGQRHQEVKHVVGQVGQLSGHSVLNDALSSLMQTAASTDTGLVITNIHGIQKLLSSGNTAIVQRDGAEEIQVPPPMKKSIHCMHEKIEDQIEPQAVPPVPGCYGDSLSVCHQFTVDENVSATSGLPQQPLRENHAVELQLREKAVLSESKVEHIQIQGLEVVAEYTRGLQEKDLVSADENKSEFGTGDNSKIWETEIEGVLDRHRRDSTDGSDEEVSFVKL